MTSQYQALADALRVRICGGDEFGIGDQLPSIAALQREYGIRSPGTVRTAQQLLVEEGLLETRMGVRPVVVGTESLRAVDVPGELARLRDRLSTILAAVDSQLHRRITLDLIDPSTPHLYFVLTESLREFASRQRWEAEDGRGDAALRMEWAEVADGLAARVEAAV